LDRCQRITSFHLPPMIFKVCGRWQWVTDDIVDIQKVSI
jgi:hypothetical protein